MTMEHPLNELLALLRAEVSRMRAEMSDADYAAALEIFESIYRAHPVPADDAGITRLKFAALTFLLGVLPQYVGTRPGSLV